MGSDRVDQSDEAREEAGTCATCAHWVANTGWNDLYAPSNDYEIKESDPERWARIEAHNRQSGICKKVQEGWADDDKTQPLPLATCWDGSQYKATLHTHRDFGCVLHEVRSDA